MGRKHLAKPFMYLIIAAGAVICYSSAAHLHTAKIDVYFLLLAIVTIVIGSRVTIRVPRINTNITVDDTFTFLAVLLYGSDAAILLAASSGICSALRISRKPRTILFAGASLAVALSVTSHVLNWAFDDTTQLIHRQFYTVVIGIGLMGLVQYFAHTGLVAIANALKDNQPIWHMWSQNFLWISVTYFIGSAAAGLIASSIGTAGFYAFLIAVPIVLIVYFSYNKYLDEVKESANQAELAERARAEQAERHVEELNIYIAEQERISVALEEAKEHFRHAAFHDSLTGLPNRAMFSELLRAEIEEAKLKPEHLFAVLFLDLDRFKYINDSLGHSYGDLVLVSFAQRLEDCLRQVDTLARFGGDEFAILLDGITDSGDAIRVAERIQEELTKPFILNDHTAFTTASVGIALSATGYLEPEDILRDADTAMYRAKENGKARYEMFDETMHARALSRLRLETDLRHAVEHQEFCVYYQPIVELGTGALNGFEALVRWQHPEKGVVSPVEFIPLAEETGLIVPMGLWVLEESCMQMRKWQQLYPAHRGLRLSVNLSGKQVAQPDLIEQITGVLQRTNLDARYLKLEITESVLMENAEAAADMFKRLRALGLQLSIDDFGTGYSSLSYLHRFPVNYLKIDRSFVSRMSDSGENFEIVKTVALLAHNLGMEVIAEGIETDEQLQKLRALECRYGQGYFFSKPVDKEAAGALLLNKERWQVSPVAVEEPITEEVELLSPFYSM